MRILFFILFICIVFAQSADAKTLKNGQTIVVGVGQVKTDVITVSKDDVVFEQNVQPVHVVSLPEGANIHVRKTGNAHVRMEEGIKLYQVKNEKGEEVYCAYNPAYFVTPGIGKSFSLEACLRDNNESGTFNELYLSEKGQLDFPPISHSRLRKMKSEFEPIPYEVAQRDDTLNQKVRIVVDKTKRETVRFEIEALTVEEEWVAQGRTEKVVANLPAEFDVFGAKIEIQKLSPENVSLRVISGMRSDQPFYFSANRMYSDKEVEFVVSD